MNNALTALNFSVSKIQKLRSHDLKSILKQKTEISFHYCSDCLPPVKFESLINARPLFLNLYTMVQI